jgi:hypothetical protein
MEAPPIAHVARTDGAAQFAQSRSDVPESSVACSVERAHCIQRVGSEYSYPRWDATSSIDGQIPALEAEAEIDDAIAVMRSLVLHEHESIEVVDAPVRQRGKRVFSRETVREVQHKRLVLQETLNGSDRVMRLLVRKLFEPLDCDVRTTRARDASGLAGQALGYNNDCGLHACRGEPLERMLQKRAIGERQKRGAR